MENIIEVVTGRRSIRRFENRVIEDEKLGAILEAARWTPSWANTQCWEIVVVRDAAIRTKMSELLSPKNPASLAIKNGPLTLGLCAAKNKAGFYKAEQSTILGDWLMYDLGLITQTICLTAHSLGLGSVIVGAFDHSKIKNLLKVPNEYELVSLVPMGYPDHAPSAPKRKEVDQFVHQDTFEIR